ncbi:hypothetical protein [Hahella sp. HN01]|uniref:hypothetical protein n=1 Tax=Hahella sp. HN01 TaxID=2847262 RepID=UPI001C1F09F1|nr:hypothetical protein [Hahella sp. HN01]MBU6954960.1 hypothetical protein [Hahella sp. HN01]
MLRIKAERLTNNGGVFFYKEEIFTGLAFFLLPEGRLRGDVIVNGCIENEYKNCYWSKISLSDICIEETFLDSGSEPVSYKGEPFNGTVFEFDKDVCVAEKYYNGGVLLHEANWTYHGDIEFLVIQENDLSQEYEWRNGVPVSLELYSEDNFKYRVGVGDTGRVYAILANGNYFEKANSLQGRVSFDLWKGWEWFEMQSISTRLAIMGDAADDKLLSYLKQASGYQHVSSIVLDDSSISMEGILSFLELKSLESIDVRDVRPEVRGVMAEFKRNRKRCRVVFNREEIVV